ELHKTCIQMQARIIDLLSQVSIDDMTVDLLRYNDEFNNVLKTFENYMLERERRVGPPSMPISNQTASTPRSVISTSPSSTSKTSSSLPRNQDNEPALIKFDEESSTLPINLQHMNINSTLSDAIPKHTPPQSTASVTTRPVSNHQDPERDVKEVEQWLNISGGNNIDNNSHQQGGTTHAFNDFIDQRASTVPDPPISEQDIQINLQHPSTQNQSNA
ncbi:unnamed protein product, partial [Rotaria sordida]